MKRERPDTGSHPGLAAPFCAVAMLVVAAAAFGAAGPASASAKVARHLRSCSPDGYGLELKPLPGGGRSRQSVLITAGWLTGTEKRRACLERTTVELTIVSDSGSVNAPAARWHVRKVLDPWSEVVHTWVWKNWCPASGQGSGSVSVELTAAGQHKMQRVPAPPTCAQPGSPSTIVARGTGTKYVQRPGDRIAPHILPKGTPPPLSPTLIRVKNAWLVSDGYTLVAVYAGIAGNDSSKGRFVVIRQNEIFGIQYSPPDIIDLGKVRAVKITSGPIGKSRETSAQHGGLRFSGANGSTGVLSLAGDRIRLTVRHSGG